MGKAKLFPILLAAMLCLLNVAVWIYLEMSRMAQYDTAFATAQANLSTNAAALSSAINRKYALMEGLYAFIQNQGIGIAPKHLDQFLDQLYEHTSGIMDTALAVGKNMTYTYPREGNEKVLGYNVFEDPRPEIRADAVRMLDSRQTVISGPYELIQGSLGLIERRAVYEGGRFVGFVSLALDMEEILNEAGFNHNDKSIVMAVRRPGQAPFFGDAATFSGRNVRSAVYLADGSWEMAAKPKKSVLLAIDRSIRIQQGAATFCCFFLFLLLYSLVGSRIRLMRLVDKRTRALNASNQELTNVIGNLTDSQRKLTALVYSDALTGISNRTYLNERLKEAYEMAGRTKLALLLLDLDHFKMVNDTFGHAAGDELLRGWVARVVQAGLKYEVFARMGGDEFVFLLQGFKDEACVETFARQIIATVQTPFLLADMELQVGLSIGIALYPQGDTTIEDLLKNADMAMYRAKAAGGNSFCLFDRSMAVNVMERVQRASEIRQALKEDQLELYYQPQVDSRTQAIVGVEALIRWNHPERGLVTPQQFIPVAEETGLALPLSEWVLEQACLQMKEWTDRGLPPIRIAVNLSASLFRQQDLEDKIKRILTQTGLPMNRLELEITEHIAIMDEHYAFLNRMLEQGVSIAIDDFGTQYSSLSYLKRFPVTKIKIDKSFIHGIDTSSKDEAIIQAMILVAGRLQLEIVAEGAETAEQVEFLRRHSCYQVQGYYYYKPMPKRQVEQLLFGERQQQGGG
jgi:diguanylate cyclase (GGDEF)-like protein